MNFEIAAGSVAGRDHRKLGKNSHDAFATHQDEHKIITVVCDGCGSSNSSEVGAKIGSKLIVHTIKELLEKTSLIDSPEIFLERVRQDALAQIRIIANRMGDDLERTILDHFLFTIIGAIVTDKKTIIFSIGDGVYVQNGEIVHLEPLKGNAPPYLAYEIIKQSIRSDMLNMLRFKLNCEIATSDLESYLLGTDGINDLISASLENIPGKDEQVDSLDQFWSWDRYFMNRDMVRRRLTLIGRDHVTLNHEKSALIKSAGHLADDTTLVVVRRRKEGDRNAGLS